MSIRFANRVLLAAGVSGLLGLLPTLAAAQPADPSSIRVLEKASGLKPGGAALFSAGKDTCVLQTIQCGQTVSSTLTTSACQLNDGSYADYWAFNGTNGQTISATMRSNSIDSYLALLDPQNRDVQENDNGAGGNDARINFQLDVT